jgi:hypothetical protein
MTSDGTSLTIEDLRRWVLAFRRACENAAEEVRGNDYYGFFGEFPKGQCLTSAYLLAQFLATECSVHPDAIRVCSNAWRHDRSHGWLKIGDLVVDITVDQFDDGGEVEYVTSDRSWHETFSQPTVKEFSPAERDGSFRTKVFFERYDLIVSRLDRSALNIPPVQ